MDLYTLQWVIWYTILLVHIRPLKYIYRTLVYLCILKSSIKYNVDYLKIIWSFHSEYIKLVQAYLTQEFSLHGLKAIGVNYTPFEQRPPQFGYWLMRCIWDNCRMHCSSKKCIRKIGALWLVYATGYCICACIYIVHHAYLCNTTQIASCELHKVYI